MGYGHVLWLFGDPRYVKDAGSSNIFIIWRTDEGRLKIITPFIDSGLILPGVTRQSIIDLAQDRFIQPRKQKVIAKQCRMSVKEEEVEPLEVVESDLTIRQLFTAAQKGNILSAFGIGTAAFAIPVSKIALGDETLRIDVNAIPHVVILREWLSAIMYGTGNSYTSWAPVVEEKDEE